jgi:hypothetical protein
VDIDELIRKSKSRRTRGAALETMRKTMDPAVTGRLTEMMDEKLSVLELETLCEGLANHEITESRDFLKGLLDHKDTELVQSALVAMSSLFGAEETESYGASLKRRAPMIRDQAMSVIRDCADARCVEAVKARLKVILARDRPNDSYPHPGPSEVEDGVVYLARIAETDSALKRFLHDLANKRWSRLKPLEQRRFAQFKRLVF